VSDGGTAPPPHGRVPVEPDADWAFDRYEAVRPRLPAAEFPGSSCHAPSLAEAAADYDGFVLDAFGVLNVGETPIPGAIARMADLRRAGKRLVILTNAASYPRPAAIAKFRRLGFDFAPEEIVTSRDAAASRLAAHAPGATWAAITAEGDDLADIPAPCLDAFSVPDALDRADAILFLSTARWSAAMQERLVAALLARPRPFVVANPDLVAPREVGLSVEPGAFAHDVEDRTGVVPVFYGKPFPDAFDDAAAALGGLPRARIAMVGDTLHTDVLGGAASGMGSILVARHGLFAGRDVAPYIRRSGIRPSRIVETT
jgi:HAD superfamily hydrolase (TIGR01459 family)